MAVMGVIIFLLLVNPMATAVVFFCLALIIINIIGYMHFWWGQGDFDPSILVPNGIL